MRTRTATLALAMILGCGALQLALVACADSDVDDSTSTGDAAGDSSTTLEPPSPEATREDDANGDADAGANAADAAVDGDADVPRCTDEAWCQTPLPASQTLRGVWGDGTGGAWSVSDEGNILRWDGAAWQIAFTTTGPLTAIWARSATDLWVGGKSGLFHGEGPDAATVSWTPVDLGEANVLITSLWGNAAGDLWAVGRSASFRGRVFTLPAAAPSWTLDPVFTRTDVTEIKTVWGTDDGDLWIIGRVGSADRIVHRRGAGQDSPYWADENPYTDKKSSDPNATFAGLGSVAGKPWVFGKVTYSNAMYWTGEAAGDGGMAWTRSNWVGLLNTLTDTITRYAVWGTENDLWTIGDRGRINHWDGTDWRTAHITLTNAPVMSNLYAMWAKSNDDIWVVGANIALHKVSQQEAQGAK